MKTSEWGPTTRTADTTGARSDKKQFAKARPLIAELETRSIQRNPYEIAMLYLEMNQADKALLWLERACQGRIPAMAFLKTAQEGHRFGIVRQHPRFARILQCADKKVE